MGMPEFNDRSFGDVVPLPTEDLKKKFEELNASAKKLHYGEMDELQKFKDLREAQNRIEEKLDRIIKHFKIYPIVGGIENFKDEKHFIP